jgi:hypothetical protein
MPIPAPVDNPPWAYSRNGEGPIVVKCAYSLPAGEDYVAKISYVGDRGLIGEVSAESRSLALVAALELLDEKGLLGKLPVSFVNDLTDYRTV